MATIISNRAATEPTTISSVNTDSSADTARTRSVESVVLEGTMSEVVVVGVVTVVVVEDGCGGGGSVG